MSQFIALAPGVRSCHATRDFPERLVRCSTVSAHHLFVFVVLLRVLPLAWPAAASQGLPGMRVSHQSCVVWWGAARVGSLLASLRRETDDFIRLPRYCGITSILVRATALRLCLPQ